MPKPGGACEVYPTFKEAVTDRNPNGRLLTMAIAQLMSHPDYSDLTPEEVFNKVVKFAKEVYS